MPAGRRKTNDAIVAFSTFMSPIIFYSTFMTLKSHEKKCVCVERFDSCRHFISGNNVVALLLRHHDKQTTKERNKRATKLYVICFVVQTEPATTQDNFGNSFAFSFSFKSILCTGHAMFFTSKHQSDVSFAF